MLLFTTLTRTGTNHISRHLRFPRWCPSRILPFLRPTGSEVSIARKSSSQPLSVQPDQRQPCLFLRAGISMVSLSLVGCPFLILRWIQAKLCRRLCPISRLRTFRRPRCRCLLLAQACVPCRQCIPMPLHGPRRRLCWLHVAHRHRLTPRLRTLAHLRSVKVQVV
jgi:hypothetical protein